MSDVKTSSTPDVGEPTGAKNVLEMRRVSKIFAGQPVLDRLDFDVPTGTVVGLLGKNGAGKTTLLAAAARYGDHPWRAGLDP